MPEGRAERSQSERTSFGLWVLAAWAAIIFLSAASVQAAGTQILRGHVPQAVAASKALGRVNPATRLQLAIGLPLRNQVELENLLKQLADPAGPNFRQYLAPAQFAERFGPSEEDYQALAAFFEAHGLAVTGTHPNRAILDVGGTVADIESTFHVNMLNWSHPTRGTFFAPDREPSVDAGVTILDITGLDNFVLPRPMDIKTHPVSHATPFTTGSGPDGLFMGGDFRAAYAPGVALNGAGQSVGLFELDGFYASDVEANFKQAGLTPVPTQTVLLDGFNGAPGNGNVEVTLDIMMAAYMAPGASRIIVYEGSNWNDVLNRMATDDLANQLSSSWGYSPTNATTEQIFKQMIAQGQSLFQASGDSGAYQGGIMPPADDPNITVVGGTSLTTAGPGGPWQSETAWPDSGGGVSTNWPIPSYQQPLLMTAAGGSGSMRNIPDVALTADIQMFLICNNGQEVEVGGTSAAAPLWAGFTALANQQAAANGKAPVGFLNPVIYGIGAGSSYESDLHDIITGNNGGFSALPGYDLATGWGSPAGQPLINALSGSSSAPGFSLSSSVSTLSIPAGTSGVAVINVAPQQGFSGAVSLAISGLPSGVTASFSPASATTSSTLTLTATNSAAAATSTVTITGASGSLTGTARIALSITTAGSFTLSATPASLSLTPGDAGASAIAISSQNGFSETVALAASGLPQGVTASFSAVSAKGGTLTLTASSSAAAGTSVITITGTSGSLQNTTAIKLTVGAAASYSITPSPASVNVPQGGSGSSTITVAPQSGFKGSVSFALTGLPTGVAATFSPVSTTHITTLTFRASSTAVPGTSTVTVTGTSGATTNTTTIAVTIPTPPSFTLSATPANLSVNAGASGVSAIAITALNGFNDSVALTVSGLPSGVTAAFGATTAGTRPVTFTATASAAAATATVTITGKSGSLTSQTALTLTIVRPPAFTLSATPTALSIAQGATGSSTFTLTPQNGFNGTVTLSLPSLPNGVAGSFSASATPASAVLTFSVAASAATGPSTIDITAKSGSLTQTVAIALTVIAPGGGSTQVNMSANYNVMGAVTDGAVFLSGSGLDGGGRAYSAKLLGTVQTAYGATFDFGAANAPDAVSSTTVALPAGKYSTLKLLATGVNGNQVSQTFQVTYTDGSTASLVQSLSDWCTPQGYTGESNAILMTYRDNSDGTRDTRPMTLYGYTLNLSNTKTVKSITLPNNRNVVVLAMNLSTSTSSATSNRVAINAPFEKTQITLFPGANRAKR
jgi:subtilase family serine protease